MQSRPVDSLAEYASGESTYRLWPHRHGCAGSFAASIECLVDNEPKRLKPKRKRDQKHQQKLPFDLSQWYEMSTEHRIVTEDAVAYAWPADAPEWLAPLGQCIRFKDQRLRTAQVKRGSHRTQHPCGAALRSKAHKKSKSTLIPPNSSSPARRSPVNNRAGKSCDISPNHWGGSRELSSGRGSNAQPISGTGKNQLPTSARFNGELSC